MSHEHVRSYVERIMAAFEHAFTCGQTRGLFPAHLQIETEASFFTSYVLGQLTLIRSNVAPHLVESAALGALQHLKSPQEGIGLSSSDPLMQSGHSHR